MTRTRKILIATGGTGGHVYPAIALAQQLVAQVPNSKILFVGGNLGSNRYFDQDAFPHATVSCGSLIDKSPKKFTVACYNIGKGICQSLLLVKRFKPDVAVGFGSYFSFPPLVAAKLLGVPLVLHEANSVPGKVNRLLAPWTESVGVHFPETVHLLKGNAVEVGMPLREGYQRSGVTPAEARLYFGLSPDATTLLVFGGSQGASVINILVAGALDRLQTGLPLQVLHFTGDPNVIPLLQKSYQKSNIQAVVKAFESNMQMAWQAADLVISRSGAGTIAEQLEFEVPGILIPYPRAAENHQDHNADFMVCKVGGAVKLKEQGLVSNRITECLTELLKNEGEMMIAMRQLMNKYKKNSRSRTLCSLVKDVLEI